MIDELVEIALQRPIAAGGVGVESTPGLDGEVGGLLHGLHGKIARRLDDDRPLTTDPGDDRGPVFVVVAPTGLAFLPTATCAAPQRLLATALRLSLVAGSMVEVIGFHRALQPTIGFVGDGGIPEPPAPAITGPTMDAQLAGNPPRRTRETEEKRRQHPVRQGPLTPVEQGSGEVVKGALAAVTPVAFTPGAIVVRPPRIDVLTLAPGTLERPIFPPRCMDGGLTRVDIEELVKV